MASLISFLVIHGMPIASRAAAIEQLPPPLTLNKILPFVCLAVVRLAFVQRVTERMRTMQWREDIEVRLEQTMPKHAQFMEHRAAQNNVVP